MLIIMYYLGTEVSRKQTSTYELNNKVQQTIRYGEILGFTMAKVRQLLFI